MLIVVAVFVLNPSETTFAATLRWTAEQRLRRFRLDLESARICEHPYQYQWNRNATCPGRILDILRAAKTLAQEYRTLTGKPLGITGEVAEYEAARLLGVELTPARQTGYDATEIRDGVLRRLQIKGRCLLPNCKPDQRRLDQHRKGVGCDAAGSPR